MRIGILGGSFDPVHCGHLLLAEWCREACQLEQVRWVPAAVPPHKLGQDRAPDRQRMEMLHLATGGHSAFSVWDIELQRGGVSYTVETLEALRAERSEDELFFLMGADSLFDLPQWRSPDRICELATLVVVNRVGNPPVDFGHLTTIAPEPRRAHFADHVVAMPLVQLSSSEIRRRTAAGLSIRYQVPRAVEEFIRTEGLYQRLDG